MVCVPSCKGIQGVSRDFIHDNAVYLDGNRAVADGIGKLGVLLPDTPD